MKHFAAKIAALMLCVFMMTAAFCGCQPEPVEDTTPTTVPSDTATTVVTIPTHVRVEATGSVFIGKWAVSSTGLNVTMLEFGEDGSVVVTMENSRIGGGFLDEDGSKLTLNVASTARVFTYTVTGDVITLENDTETWTLTKIA